MIIFTFLPNFMCLTRILKRWLTAKTVFGQDVFNTHRLECTCSNVRIFFLKIMMTLLGHWFGRRQRHTFCNEAKTIIVVDIWLNSLISFLQSIIPFHPSHMWWRTEYCSHPCLQNCSPSKHYDLKMLNPQSVHIHCRYTILAHLFPSPFSLSFFFTLTLSVTHKPPHLSLS